MTKKKKRNPKISRKVTGFKTLPTTKRFKWVKLRRNITPGLKTGPILKKLLVYRIRITNSC